MKKVLFICKKNQAYTGRDSYGPNAYTRRSSGLFNSTSFVAQAVNGVVVEVVDNNDIDREVSKHKPDYVVIEALWVVPSKFTVLKKLHPTVSWFVHLHSNMPFLALEGVAIEWLYDYLLDHDVKIIVNCKQAQASLMAISMKSVYLPNIYPPHTTRKHDTSHECCTLSHEREIHVACFGAIRPMKNQLIQAMAAVEFARKRNKVLFFHINGSRVETNGENILKNLRALFKTQVGVLVEHDWKNHQEFLTTLAMMDIGMQVSLSETFNIVSADMVSVGLPVVVSKEIGWTTCLSQADSASVQDIVKKMERAYKWGFITKINQLLLKRDSKIATRLWKQWAL